ncbi:hypothetical protein A2U01_0053576, partial [Trifolium medium]|nr:hypothetical protein [Trifolium medium]
MVTGPDSYIGHPFVITTLCRLREVPAEEATDEISNPERPLGQTYFRRAVRDFRQYKQQQQHHHSHHQQRHSRSSIRLDWGLPHYSPPLMTAVQDYRAQVLIPSYYQQYPQQTDLTGHFQ